jgi:hypothetical protein
VAATEYCRPPWPFWHQFGDSLKSGDVKIQRARSMSRGDGTPAKVLVADEGKPSHPDEFETRFRSASIRERLLVTRPKRSSVVLAAASFCCMPSSSVACNCCS